MNLDKLSEAIEHLTSHSAKCGGSCMLEGEQTHVGLAVVFIARCSKCHQSFRIDSSSAPKVQVVIRGGTLTYLLSWDKCPLVEAKQG